jgi:hypothetical protein
MIEKLLFIWILWIRIIFKCQSHILLLLKIIKAKKKRIIFGENCIKNEKTTHIFSLNQWFISFLKWIFPKMVVFLWMCETMDLIKHLSKLDFGTKYIGISFENQLLKRFGNLFKIQYTVISRYSHILGTETFRWL